MMHRFIHHLKGFSYVKETLRGFVEVINVKKTYRGIIDTDPFIKGAFKGGHWHQTKERSEVGFLGLQNFLLCIKSLMETF